MRIKSKKDENDERDEPIVSEDELDHEVETFKLLILSESTNPYLFKCNLNWTELQIANFETKSTKFNGKSAKSLPQTPISLIPVFL